MAPVFDVLKQQLMGRCSQDSWAWSATAAPSCTAAKSKKVKNTANKAHTGFRKEATDAFRSVSAGLLLDKYRMVLSEEETCYNSKKVNIFQYRGLLWFYSCTLNVGTLLKVQ